MIQSTLQGIFKLINFFSLGEYLMIAGEADRTCLSHQAVGAETLKLDIKYENTNNGCWVNSALLIS